MPKRNYFFFAILFILILIYFLFAIKQAKKIDLRIDEIISILIVKSINFENSIPHLPSNNHYIFYLFHFYLSKIFSYFVNEDQLIIRLPNIFLHSISSILLYFLIIKLTANEIKNLLFFSIVIIGISIFLFDLSFFYLSIDGRFYESYILFFIIFLWLFFNNVKFSFLIIYLILSGIIIGPFFWLFLISFLIINFFYNREFCYKKFFLLISIIFIFLFHLFLASNEKSIYIIFNHLKRFFILNNPFYYLKNLFIYFPVLTIFFIIFFVKSRNKKILFQLFFPLFLIYFFLSFTFIKNIRLLYIISPLILLFVISELVLFGKKKILFFLFIFLIFLTNYIKYKTEYFYFFDPTRINFEKFKRLNDKEITDILTTNPIICYYFKPDKNITVFREEYYKDLINEKNINRCYYTGKIIITGKNSFLEYFENHSNFIFFTLQKEFFNNRMISKELREMILKKMKYLSEFSSPKYFVFIKN
ncbi:MAG TPA: hypothetical protein PLD27_06025 [bacterium]|nr:hypothetical protein [bacterium]HOL46883.1 hypothetical protein [bacterium]HPQ18768.1 hypothetical protein [bacterium]